MRFLRILARFWEALDPPKIENSEKIRFFGVAVLKEGSGRVLGRFLEDFERVLDRFWVDFGRVLDRFCDDFFLFLGFGGSKH